ncbi:YggS family pyridoxal phosphate-dependent enzyme [Horticoccus luteus]|uniref:Pyridoxal phosphate homeostasis protein n=2 Tax=Horticoccus luteus TaxID=2862869 RepID=A0A8F9XLI5_9BACT|nr:YggS family pyridoxal phosphate-dependent enzyme [Horticoccus luteus]
MLRYEDFLQNLAHVQADIAAACARARRTPGEVQLLAVTKTHPAAAAEFAARAGLRAVGENRVQEAIEKRALSTAPIAWELIGHLQSNKVRLAAAHFDRVQSVDREKLLPLLARAADELGRTLPVLLQINAGDDPAKFGADVAEAPALLESALAQRSLRVDGLMTIAPLSDDPEIARRTFARLRTLRDELAARFGVPLRELSMGMSGDLALAIAEGSTLIRVGTALFGARPPRV